MALKGNWKIKWKKDMNILSQKRKDCIIKTWILHCTLLVLLQQWYKWYVAGFLFFIFLMTEDCTFISGHYLACSNGTFFVTDVFDWIRVLLGNISSFVFILLFRLSLQKRWHWNITDLYKEGSQTQIYKSKVPIGCLLLEVFCLVLSQFSSDAN